MAWIRDDKNEPKYVESIYDKDCLPTWFEINEFITNKAYVYDVSVDTDMDIYWKRPVKLLRLGWLCNQLNKMVFEDKFSYAGLQKEVDIAWSFNHISFVLAKDSPSALIEHINDDLTIAPPIYQCKLPGKDTYSIFKSSHPFIDIDTLGDHVELIVYLYNDDGENGDHVFGAAGRFVSHESESFEPILSYILKDVIQYFSGTPGWKDENGNLIDTDKISQQHETCYDPAL